MRIIQVQTHCTGSSIEENGDVWVYDIINKVTVHHVNQGTLKKSVHK